MSHPYVVENLGKLRYEQLRQEADAKRRLRQSRGAAPSLAEQAGDLLVALGQKLGGGQRPAPRKPAWRLK